MTTTTDAPQILNYDTLYFPAEPGQSRMIAITVVLVASTIGDYAAYIGHGTPEWVAGMGDKLSFAMARGFFPDIHAEDYRS